MTVPRGYTVLSNTKAASVEESGDRARVVFEKTPRMSTYLFALVVGKDFTSATAKSGGTDITVYSPFGSKDDCEYAVERAKDIFSFFQQKLFRKVIYPISKMGMHLRSILKSAELRSSPIF